MGKFKEDLKINTTLRKNMSIRRFTVSEELVQKIAPKSYTIEDSPKANRLVGEQILLAIDVVGGLEYRLNRHKNFNEFNLFERGLFLEKLAESISYDDYDRINPTMLQNDNYFVEIVDLVKRDLCQYLKQNEVKYRWGSVKVSNSGDVIVSPPNKP